MSLRDNLCRVRARERSGAQSSDRFDFQKNWALCKLLELHSSGADYCLLLEYHEDVVVLDSEADPQEAHFYQIKTKHAANWTLQMLLKRTKGKDGPLHSILGKLYLNRVSFDEDVGSLNFVSNASFEIPLADESAGPSTNRTLIRIADLSDRSKNKIVEVIMAELSLNEQPDLDNIITVQVCGLSLLDHSDHALGKLGSFLESMYPGRKVRPVPVYQALFDEIRRRNNLVATEVDFDDLVRLKAIGRQAFSRMLEGLCLGVDLDSLWNGIELRLNTENYSFTRIQSLKRHWRNYEVQRMDQSNAMTRNLSVLARKAASEASGMDHESLGSFMKAALESCRLNDSDLIRTYGEDYVTAAILLEHASLHEH